MDASVSVSTESLGNDRNKFAVARCAEHCDIDGENSIPTCMPPGGPLQHREPMERMTGSCAPDRAELSAPKSLFRRAHAVDAHWSSADGSAQSYHFGKHFLLVCKCTIVSGASVEADFTDETRPPAISRRNNDMSA